MVRASIYGSNASNAYGSGGNLNGPVGGAAVLSAGSAHTRIDEKVAQAAEASAAVLRAWRRVIIVSPFMRRFEFSLDARQHRPSRQPRQERSIHLVSFPIRY